MARARGRRADRCSPSPSWSRRGRSIVSNELGRFVPVCTGGGKALFIGTYLPGDGLHEGTKQHLYHRFRGTDPSPEELRLLPMNPLLDEVAEKYPQLPRDEALGRVGRENLDPLGDQRAARRSRR